MHAKSRKRAHPRGLVTGGRVFVPVVRNGRQKWTVGVNGETNDSSGRKADGEGAYDKISKEGLLYEQP